jgi:hypothetical protein
MQGRSWMAALTLAAATALALQGGTRVARADDPAVVNKITLTLKITGLGREGCEVEIKPGHAACEFKKISQKLDRNGQIDLKPFEVKSTSADHDCLFAITVKEPGQPVKTVKRGLVLVKPAPGARAVPSQNFSCLLRSPSLAARDDSGKTIR